MSNQQKSTFDEVRREVRTKLDIKAIVQGRSGPDQEWKETVEIENASRSGASFHLSQGCDMGNLLMILLPLPPELRAYDLYEKLYPVIGLVQYCTETIYGGNSSFKVGVAFVGKDFPDSYVQNPMQNYHIVGALPSGIWRMTESSTPFTQRRSVRYWAPTEVLISLFQREEESQSRDRARALNISSGGALIVSSLKPDTTERVKLRFTEYDFHTVAEVRNCRPAKPGTWAVHLEFVESRFPVERVVEKLREKTKAMAQTEGIRTEKD